VKEYSPQSTQRGCAATKIETDIIITTKVAKSTKEKIEM